MLCAAVRREADTFCFFHPWVFYSRHTPCMLCLKIRGCLPPLDLSFSYFLMLSFFPPLSLSLSVLCSYCWTRRLARSEVSYVYYKEFHFSVGLETAANECVWERESRGRERGTWGSTAPDTGCSRPLCQWDWMREWQLQQDPQQNWHFSQKKIKERKMHLHGTVSTFTAQRRDSHKPKKKQKNLYVSRFLMPQFYTSWCIIVS